MDKTINNHLRSKKNSYLRAVNLTIAMNNFRNDMSDKNRDTLDHYAYNTEKLPLPSGRIGNAIALALETNNYIATEYLMQNADRLKLSLTYVVLDLDGRNPWGIKDEYLFSQLTKESTDGLFLPGIDTNDYREYLRELQLNEEANRRLSIALEITEEEKEIVGFNKTR